MTINGSHTIGEIRDLMNSYDYQFIQLSQAYDKAAAQWNTADATAAQLWKTDFDYWNTSVWQPARTAGNTALAGTPTFLQDVTTDEATYQSMAAAFLPLADFDRRLRSVRAVASFAPAYANNPQPKAPDADLGAYKAADATLEAIPKPGDIPNLLPTLTLTQKIVYGAIAVVSLGVIIKIAK